MKRADLTFGLDVEVKAKLWTGSRRDRTAQLYRATITDATTTIEGGVGVEIHYTDHRGREQTEKCRIVLPAIIRPWSEVEAARAAAQAERDARDAAERARTDEMYATFFERYGADVRERITAALDGTNLTGSINPRHYWDREEGFDTVVEVRGDFTIRGNMAHLAPVAVDLLAEDLVDLDVFATSSAWLKPLALLAAGKDACESSFDEDIRWSNITPEGLEAVLAAIRVKASAE